MEADYPLVCEYLVTFCAKDKEQHARGENPSNDEPVVARQKTEDATQRRNDDRSGAGPTPHCRQLI
jgi:hypothetical protein